MPQQPVAGLAGLLRQLRTEAGLTQEELAHAAGVSARAIIDLEHGVNQSARKDTAGLLANGLGLTGSERERFLAVARGKPVSVHSAARAADAVSNPDLALENLQVRLGAQFEKGRHDAAAATARDLKERAEQLRHPEFIRLAAMWDVTVANLEGRFADAEELAAALDRRLQQLGHPQAEGITMMQTFIRRWLQGQAAEYIQVFELLSQSSPANRVWPAVTAWCLAEAGARRRAADLLRQLTPTAANTDENYHWWAVIVGLSIAADRTRDARQARVLYDLAAPHSGNNATLGTEVFLGAADHWLGVLAGAAGRHDQATAHLDAALARHQEMGARPWTALTQDAYADVLKARAQTDIRGLADTPRASVFRESALRTADALGLAVITNRRLAAAVPVSAPPTGERSMDSLPPETGSGNGGGVRDDERRAGGDEPSRYLSGHLPERASVGRRIGLVVCVTLGRPGGSSAPLKQFGVSAGGRDITISVSAPGLIPLGDLDQDLHVPADDHSEPIWFGFRTGRTGLHRVIVRAFAAGTFLGELMLEVSVEAGAAMEESPIRSAPMVGLAAEPGEVTLQVSRTDDDRYSFQLIGEALYRVELSRRLAGDPTQVVRALTDELRAMAAGASPYGDPVLVRSRIRSLGAQLWADVVPVAIRRQFWEQADRIKLFTVASDMDTVPWELLYPVDGDNDDGFLAEQFPVVRRVYGQGRVRSLNLSSAVYVVPPGSPANAMDEVAAVRAHLGDRIRDQGVCSGLHALLGLLDDSPSLLHFTCHNAFTDAEGSVMSLEGGPWRPSDLAVSVQKKSLAGVSPLVFLNACRTAGEIPGLIKTVGWARQFMGAGAGAFIGSLWAVRSRSAREFADEFYRALVVDGKPLGQASLHARQMIAGDGGDPTWLAYAIYGNPSATIGETS